MIDITIDNEIHSVETGMTILEVLKEKGFNIPTLCYHPALKPSGSCKLCAVEVETRSGHSMAMLSCVLKVKDGLVIRTSGEAVGKAREKAFHRLIQMAPHAEEIREMARCFGVEPGPPPDGCIRCRMCIRVCKEIVGVGALHMEKRDGRDFVVPIENRCIGCGTCANICPTKVIHVRDLEKIRKISIRNEVIGKHPLERCEGCGRMYATPKFLEHIKKRTDPHPDVKVHHKYCPTCAKLFSERVKSSISRKQRMVTH
jgi:predicted molibdopterin-dependent oxidoreductase YjgC